MLTQYRRVSEDGPLPALGHAGSPLTLPLNSRRCLDMELTSGDQHSPQKVNRKYYPHICI